jgi:hypothetical protein
MGTREMGRHWSTEEGRQVSTLREIEGEQKKVSKMRTTCKSHTDDKRDPSYSKEYKGII